MSLEALKQEILKSADARRKEILEEAKLKAEKILEDAKVRAERIIKKKRESIMKDLSERKKAAYAVARLEGKKKVLTKRDEIVRHAFEEARKRLIKLKGTGRYRNILTGYITEALKELNIVKARLRVSKDDYVFVKKNLKSIEKDVSKSLNKKVSLELLEEYINILGGVVVSDEEDKVFYTNTFDSRLNRIYDEERDDVLKILFGD